MCVDVDVDVEERSRGEGGLRIGDWGSGGVRGENGVKGSRGEEREVESVGWGGMD